MCDPILAAGALQATSQLMQGYQAKQQGEYAEGVAQFNAGMQRNEATRVRNKGVVEENKQRRKVAEMVSKQRAQAAASGADVNSGSVLQLQDDAKLLGELDALQIRDNFTNDARNMEIQAGLTEMEGRNARKKGEAAFRGSILSAFGAGAQAYGLSQNWYTDASAANQVT